ncbi:HAD family hydrolase [Metabacillus bambusae]|uniref:HAD family hydrolase n=1 Tax=Metabacillus bambusae TaxID=2795218 RepID=A0ABS3N2X3_9BACI|nr:HAD family hydrolase [Metabacillus bambusae]MBO1512539.1 HAD family hydrolase [Metabacillus bambusae]
MHSLRETEAVFFDLDDTLYDQLAPFQRALDHFRIDLANTNVEELFKKVRYFSDVLWKVHTRGEISLELLRIERVRCAFNDFGLSLSNQQASEVQERYEFEQQQINPFPEVISIIKDLQSRKSTVGILTNGPVQHQMNKIKALQIDQIIPPERIFISDGIGIAKPDKRVFEYVQRQVNIESNKCCYIGDTWENDVVPPIEAGWTSIWFNHRKREPQSNHIPLKTIMNYDNFMLKLP